MAGTKTTRRNNQLESWQKAALKKGRTPLPERPGYRPWLSNGGSSKRSLINLEKAPASAVSTKEPPPPPPRPPPSPPPNQGKRRHWVWTKKDVERLLQMKKEGNKWNDIAKQFPNRTLEALKREHWKIRKERRESETNSNSTDGDENMKETEENET